MVKIIEYNGDEYLFISGNVPSLKNSKVKSLRGIFSSPAVNRYIRALGIQSFSSRKKIIKGYVTKPNEFLKTKEYFTKYLITKPYKIGFHFVRGSKHKYDFNNANQLIADLLTAHDIIEDDDTTQFLPFPMEMNEVYSSYSKENPGVYIRVL
jgi:ribulose bisphosphate carboxylase small subunit